MHDAQDQVHVTVCHVLSSEWGEGRLGGKAHRIDLRVDRHIYYTVPTSGQPQYVQVHGSAISLQAATAGAWLAGARHDTSGKAVVVWTAEQGAMPAWG